ncbi:MAG: malto-oligosyltrehalose synthase [Dehalococcoidia bacterium]
MPRWQRRIPVATYRLQFNSGFTFHDARKVVPYLFDLGISDVYASPYFRARADSTHGYDIADHNSLNPAIGTEADYEAFVQAIREREMGQVLDFVPNHMGIGESANAWWMDVLENGQASLYADFFDIDWRPLKEELRSKVLLPILGDQYGVVLENGELTLRYADGSFTVHYYDHRLPIAPKSAIVILQRALPAVVDKLGPEHEHALELQSITTGLNYLPAPVQTSRDRRRERAREKEILRRRLAALCTSSPEVRTSLDDAVASYNGTSGDPSSFDSLDELLEAQPYRLSYWRTAGEEINYRRFFDINDLAAIRVENSAVFEESHRLLFRLLREGAVTGLRLDHPDGLWDPVGYVARLQQRYLMEQLPDDVAVRLAAAEQYDAALAGDPHSDRARPLYILVEKILSGRERLPARWPVDGTTGYEFANAVTGVFVDRANRRAFDQIYDSFTRTDIEYRDLMYEQKRLIMRTALAGELNVLAYQLNSITEMSRRHRDFTLNGLRTALREVIACFPVYRTYMTGEGSIDPHDRAAIDSAIARARRLNPTIEPTILSFIRDVLLFQHESDRERNPDLLRNFVMKFQQVTGPVMAKGVEDTAFYIFNRLVSLNEVGGEPEHFGTTVPAFHKLNAERAERWPHAMNATSTHDTKRSEDVRARINVLSELPSEWSAALEQWRTLNRPKKAILEDRVAPDRNEEYLFYQTLLGAWPLEPMDGDAYRVFRERIAAYMLKAIKESKVNTSWINPNADYDEAVQAFVHAVLGRTPDNAFVRSLRPLLAIVARFGAYYSLGQTLLKITAPGVPDIYQGTELWDFSLVDPDNRRPVDYRLRSRGLRQLMRRIESAGDDLAPLCRRLLASWQDGRIKLFVTHRALCFRREHAALFRNGDYLPLSTNGDHAEHVVAFARRLDAEAALVIVPRHLVRIAPKRGHPLGADTWGSSLIVLPESRPGTRYRHILSGAIIESVSHDAGAALPLADAFRDFPLALLQELPDA